LYLTSSNTTFSTNISENNTSSPLDTKVLGENENKKWHHQKKSWTEFIQNSKKT